MISMMEPAERKASYDDLHRLPAHVTGEIIDGELLVTPRPAAEYANAAFLLSSELGPAYRLGRGGPGGWIILAEQEIMLGENLLVPDFSGWRKERFPGWPKENWISTAPDWVCEILSPATIRTDRVRKMPIYASYGVSHLWLIDPRARTLEVFRLEAGGWFMAAGFAEDDKVRAGPFPEVELDLATFWVDGEAEDRG